MFMHPDSIPACPTAWNFSGAVFRRSRVPKLPLACLLYSRLQGEPFDTAIKVDIWRKAHREPNWIRVFTTWSARRPDCMDVSVHGGITTDAFGVADVFNQSGCRYQDLSPLPIK